METRALEKQIVNDFGPAKVPIPYIEFPGSLAWLTAFLQETDTWLFRGQKEYSEFFDLKPSIYRAAEKLNTDILSLEERVFKEFKRRVPLNCRDELPKEDDTLQWLALMQHYGGPTRLLDFTRSVYVALFFAVESGDSKANIWCINESAIKSIQDPIWSDDKNVVLRKLIIPNEEDKKKPIPLPPNYVFKDEPFYLSRRLGLQQGSFLIPLNIRSDFGSNLFCGKTGLLAVHSTDLENIHEFITKTSIFKIRIKPEQFPSVRKQLRKMNITREHLFPGLDGLAQSFWQEY